VSSIRVVHGTATVELAAMHDAPQVVSHSHELGGVFPHYAPRDLADAACAALLAVNTPQAVALAHLVYERTAQW
jgi:hypothetical protein